MADDDYEDEDFGDADETEEVQPTAATAVDEDEAENYEAEYDDDVEPEADQPGTSDLNVLQPTDDAEELEDQYDAAEFDDAESSVTHQQHQPQQQQQEEEEEEEEKEEDLEQHRADSDPRAEDGALDAHMKSHAEEYSMSDFPSEDDATDALAPLASTAGNSGLQSSEFPDLEIPAQSGARTLDPAVDGVHTAVDADAQSVSNESRPLRPATPERPNRARSSSVPQIELLTNTESRSALLRRSSTPRMRLQPFITRLPSVQELNAGKEDEPGATEPPSPVDSNAEEHSTLESGALESASVMEEAATEVARARSRSRTGSISFVPRLESLREINVTTDGPDTQDDEENTNEDEEEEEKGDEQASEPPQRDARQEPSIDDVQQSDGASRVVQPPGVDLEAQPPESLSTTPTDVSKQPTPVISSSSTRSQSPISEELPPATPRISQDVGAEYGDADDEFLEEEEEHAVPRETRELVAMDVDPEEQSRRETEALLQEAKLLLSDALEDDGAAQLAAYGEDDFSEGNDDDDDEEATATDDVYAEAVDGDNAAVDGYEDLYDSEGEGETVPLVSATTDPAATSTHQQISDTSPPAIVSEPITSTSAPATSALALDQPSAKQEIRTSSPSTSSSGSSVAPATPVSRPLTGTRVVTPSNAKPPERRPPPTSRQSIPQQKQQQQLQSTATKTRTAPTPTPPPSRPSRQAPVAAPRATTSSSSSSRHARLVGSSSSGAPRSPVASTRASSPPPAQSPPPRKAPVFRQKRRPTPRESSRRTLSPVKCPPQLRIELPSADKEQRTWLLLNMFRHGDDTRQYEAFIPRISPDAKGVGASTSTASLPSRPTSSAPASTAVHRVDDAASTATTSASASGSATAAATATSPPEHQDSDAISETFERLARRYGHGRRLRPSRESTTNAALRSRERNWVATRPYDSALPRYDSILDPFCKTVTSPVVQRQIYATRLDDLSPQLALVLERRAFREWRLGASDHSQSLGRLGSAPSPPAAPQP